MKRTPSLITLLLIVLLSLGGCARPAAEPTTLRVGLLPILDALPFYVAEEEGYFADAGLAVTFVPVASAAERDQLLTAGQVDVVIDDLVSLLLLDRESVRVVAVRVAMRPTETFAQFRLLAAPQSPVQTVDDLRGLPVGVSEGTIVEYLTDRLLEAAGFAPDEIAVVAVPRIPDRMALLESGELQAAMLPEPPASLAIAQGAMAIIDDRSLPDLACSLVSVRAELAESQPQAVEAMLAALEKAVQAINADKEHWTPLLTEHHLLPPALADDFTLPDYPAAQVPSPAAFHDVQRWLTERGMLTTAPPYADLVRDEFLP